MQNLNNLTMRQADLLKTAIDAFSKFQESLSTQQPDEIKEQKDVFKGMRHQYRDFFKDLVIKYGLSPIHVKQSKTFAEICAKNSVIDYRFPLKTLEERGIVEVSYKKTPGGKDKIVSFKFTSYI